MCIHKVLSLGTGRTETATNDMAVLGRDKVDGCGGSEGLSAVVGGKENGWQT